MERENKSPNCPLATRNGGLSMNEADAQGCLPWEIGPKELTRCDDPLRMLWARQRVIMVIPIQSRDLWLFNM